MRNAVLVLAALVAFAAPAAAFAEEAPEAKHGIPLKLGIATGYGNPMGDATKDNKLSDVYSGEVPLELELSYEFTHAISAGLYFGYGYGLLSSNDVNGFKASDEFDSISALRFGVQGEYEFGKVGPALPFAALRVGYVSESAKVAAGGTEKTSGWEYFTLVGGADFEAGKGFAVGPFVSFSLGQYTSETPAGGSSESIPSSDRALHEWLTIGVRGSYSL